jgi:hypothetical protein
LSNSLVAFALPDVSRKPLPVSVSKAVAAAAAARRGAPKVGAFAPVALPAGGDKALVEKTCGSGCHSIEVVTSQRMNATDWNSIVQSMVSRGAQASDAVKIIAEYLVKTLGVRLPRWERCGDMVWATSAARVLLFRFFVGRLGG